MPEVGLARARVCAVHGDRLTVLGPDGPWTISQGGALGSPDTPPLDRPTVGDWVAVRRTGDDGVAVDVLARTSLLVRKAAGRAATAQALAANVDTLFVVTAIGPDLSARRVERFVVLAHHGGVTPVVVLNKADLDPDIEETARRLSARLGGALVVPTRALDADAPDALAPWLTPGATVAFVGSSGVGKSTLVNRVLGIEHQETQPVRGRDDTGRHTTSRRDLLVTAGGVAVIDTPGLREVGLWADGAAIDEAFDDVEAVASRCRFRDCRHEGEPGCAVAQAAASGSLDPDRVASRVALAREAEDLARRADPRVALETKRSAKVLSRAVRESQRRKGR